MSSRVFAPIEADLLVWARQSIGYDMTHAAKKIGISEDKLRSWESGDAQPTVTQLRKISNVYKRPLAVFFLPKRPSKFDKPFSALDLRDFRRLPDTEKQKLSPALLLELKKAEERREVVLSLMEEQAIDTPTFELSASQDDTPETLAERVRIRLNVSLEEQFSWDNPNTAFRHWSRIIEAVGVLVFQTGFYQGEGVKLQEMRGIAISMPTLPIILLNGADAASGRIFTLFHELGHLLKRVSGISDVIEIMSAFTPDEQIEVFCNQFAAEFLVPTKALLEEPTVRQHRPGWEWSDDEIEKLASRFKVSREVVVRRLTTIQVVSADFYRAKRQQYKEEAEGRAGKKKKPGAPARDRMLAKWHGGKYVTTVLDAYRNDVITLNDVHDYLGAKTPQVDKLLR
ncbi:MAG: ImmA/IrrE family metallo-endopeptidase, partial [Anaerolineae bacterium]|nr:ImmA/IrrE family metallo-endopeptidase [Anaerolineae bacterium]